MSVAIIDFGLGNLLSLSRALDSQGVSNRVVTRLSGVSLDEPIVLPGVGAFGRAMSNINSIGLAGQLRDRAKGGAVIIGICLGMQLLFDYSTEGGPRTQGLGIVPGYVDAIPAPSRVREYRLPHVGWHGVEANPTITPQSWHSRYLTGREFYFTHSYGAVPADNSSIIGSVKLGENSVTAAVQVGNILGFQFHPEKSSDQGLALLKFACEGSF